MSAARLTPARAAVVFLCFASAYFMSYGLRAVNAVIAPELIGEFSLSHSELGSLTSAYFLSFAAMQLPLGVWLDRFGARRTHATLLVLGAAGCVAFSLASGVSGLWFGRALIGVGVASALMAALKGFRFWYPAERQPTLAAWMLTAGTLGALAVTVPVQAALPLLGWRGVFMLAGALVLAAAIAIWFGLPHDEERSLVSAPDAGGMAGYLEVFTSGYFWRHAVLMIVFQSSFISLQTLWAGPWFIEVLGMDAAGAARGLLAFNAVLLAAYLVLGWAAPRLSQRGWGVSRLASIAAALTIVVQLAIGLTREPWAWLIWLLVAVLTTAFTTVQSHVGMSYRRELTGRAYTSLNLVVFAGIFLHQWVFGVLVDAFRADGLSTPDAFVRTMLAWQAVQAIALVQFVLWRPAAPVVE